MSKRVLFCGVCEGEIKWLRRGAAECKCGKSRVAAHLVEFEEEPVPSEEPPPVAPATEPEFDAWESSLGLPDEGFIWPDELDTKRVVEEIPEEALPSAPTTPEPVSEPDWSAPDVPWEGLVESTRTSSEHPNISNVRREETFLPDEDWDHPPLVRFFVQSVPGRPAFELTQRLLDESDAAHLYQVVEQIEGDTGRQTFVRLMQTMALCDATYVVRLEDDLAGVNLHLLHNVSTWLARFDPRFGAGWLFAPGGGYLHQSHHPYGSERWSDEMLHGALGVMMRRTDVFELLRHCEAWFEANPGAGGDDMALGYAVRQTRRQIAIHSPSLLEHNLGPSISGHVTHPVADSSDGWFNREWKRP